MKLTLIFMFGLVFGSFLNVLIHRLPREEDVLVKPSHCTSCGKHLRWWHKIPLVGYLILGGKCAHCKTKISIQYPLVELTNAALWGWIFWNTPDFLTATIFALAASAMIVIAVIDAKTLTIPDPLNAFLLILGLVFNIYLRDWEFTKSALIAFGTIGGFFWIVAAATRGGIGGGDVKLIAVMGLFFGVPEQIAIVMVAMFVFSVVGLCLRQRKMAMGPFLAASFVWGAVWGKEMVRWYLETIGV